MMTDKYTNLNDGIYSIDARYICPGNACCYLMIEGDEVAIIETGTTYTADGIDEALRSLGLGDETVKYIIPTHVHLDHAGGAGVLIKKYHKSRLVIHPKGARHMVNPDKLIAGSKAVYGEKRFTQFYGEIVPVSEDRILIMKDKDKLYLKKRVLEFRDTPGHADHHFCIWDHVSQGWFSGDTFGISYELMGNEPHRVIVPTTSPVQFDPDKLITSINLMMSYRPKQFFLTHFGAVRAPEKKACMLTKQIESYRKIAYKLRFESDRESKIYLALKKMTLAYILEALPNCDIDMMGELLELDFKLNAQGLDIWLSKLKQKI